MKKTTLILTLAVAVLLFTAACTATPVDVSSLTADEPAGFWLGLWHGIIAPFAFIISLFNDSIAVYEVANNGNWYNLGFLLGASMIFGGSGTQARGRSRSE